MGFEQIHWKYQTALTPLFIEGAGNRLALARMKLQLTQAELGKRLGVSQNVISNLEKGKTRTGDFTLAKFLAVMGELTNLVLTGAGKDSFNESAIRKDYWDFRLKKNRGKDLLNNSTDNADYVNPSVEKDQKEEVR